MMAVLLALLAAALFGLTVHLQRRGLDHMDDLNGTLITLGTVAGMLWLAAPFLIETEWWATRAMLIFAACGLVFPALSQRLQVKSVAVLGPSLGSALASTAPVFAAVPAVVLLGETLTPRIALGIGLMIAGAVIASWNPKGIKRGWPIWALLIPLGASFFRGIVQPVTKFGFSEVPSPFFATLVMASVSFALIGLIRLFDTGRANRFDRKGTSWFVLNGLFIGLGILSMQSAIRLSDVVVAAPLVSTTPLWTLLFGLVLFRRDAPSFRHLLVAVVIVLGVVVVVTR